MSQRGKRILAQELAGLIDEGGFPTKFEGTS